MTEHADEMCKVFYKGKEIKYNFYETQLDARSNCVYFRTRADIIKDNIKFNPKGNAENTIHWFLYGRKYRKYLPEHYNCRCSTIKLIKKEELK